MFGRAARTLTISSKKIVMSIERKKLSHGERKKSYDEQTRRQGHSKYSTQSVAGCETAKSLAGEFEGPFPPPLHSRDVIAALSGE